MIVVDSSVWIARLRGQTGTAVDRLVLITNPAHIIVGDLVLFELLRGTRDDRDAASLMRWLSTFLILPVMDTGIAVAAAQNSRILRAKGVTVRKAVDLLIATFCIAHRHALLHQDRDFDQIAKHLPLTVI